MNGRAKLHYFLKLYRKSEIFETVFQNMMRASIIARLCQNKGEMQSQVRHFRFASELSQRPAPAVRVTRGRGSLGISEKETETQDSEITFQGTDSSLLLFLLACDSSCWWEEVEGRGLLGSLFHRSFERHNNVPLKYFFGEFFHEFLVTSPAHSLAE